MRRSVVGMILACAAAFSAAPAAGQGSAVYTHSGCMSARAGAGVALPCDDGSAIFYNPAALATQNSVLGVGVQPIVTGGSFVFDRDGMEVERETATVPVPHGWLSWRATDRLAIGIGAWAPYGLGIEWPETFEGRYVGYDTELRALYIQPTVAYQLIPGFLSVGGGIDFVRGSVQIRQHIDLATQPIPGTQVPFEQLGIPRGTSFADATLEGDGSGTTWHLGMQAHAPRFSAGWRYMHRATVRMDDGTASFEPIATGILLPPGNPIAPPGTPIDAILGAQFQPGGPLVDQGLSSEITFPAQFVAGARFQALQRLALYADYQWTGWRTFDEFPIDFEVAPDQALILDYRDASTIRVGMDFGLTEAFTLRGGWIFNTAATPDETVTPLLPEARRNYLTAGLGWELGDRLSIDLGYQLIMQEDRRGRVRPRPSRAIPAEALNVGTYTGTGHVFGATLGYRFGPLRPALPRWGEL
jgi:long-chain fatty acid transport protein